MKTVRTLAHAKLNLTLDVTGAEGGYHMLDTLVTTVDIADKIVVRRRKDDRVNAVMHGMKSETIFPEHNNAVRAARAFQAKFKTAGVDITVYKNIPIGAGLGGSSADAAGVLNALSELFEVNAPDAVKEIADGLGSDTGYLLRGGFARLRGRGEQVERFESCPEMHFLLICPPTGVSTAECFGKYDELKARDEKRTERCLAAWKSFGTGAAARLFGNDLYGAACSINPAVQTALRQANSFSPSGAGMTGSGSACFALFETRELADWAKSRYRGAFSVYCADAIM